jgi:hypothetical protein
LFTLTFILIERGICLKKNKNKLSFEELIQKWKKESDENLSAIDKKKKISKKDGKKQNAKKGDVL